MLPSIPPEEWEALTRRYPLIEIPLTVAGRPWRITAVQDQDALVSRIRTEEDLQNFPYGLMLWPAALGLAERLAAEPGLVQGRTVLEIGAGVGLAGLVAAHHGASAVVQTDFLKDALTLCRHNARENGISTIETRVGDWRDWPDDFPRFPLVIGSDVLYERSLHPVLRALLPRLVTPGGTILLSDPLRPQALDFIEQMERAPGWSVFMESAQTVITGERKDLALFRLHHQP